MICLGASVGELLSVDFPTARKFLQDFEGLPKVLWLCCFPINTTFHLWVYFWWCQGGWREKGCLNVFFAFLLGSPFHFKKGIGWLISYSVTCSLGLCWSFRNLATVSCSFLPARMPRFPTCRWWTWWATVSHCDRERGWGQSMNMGGEFGKHSWVTAGSLQVHSFLPAVIQSSYSWSDHVDNSSIPMLTLRPEKSILCVLDHHR